MHARVMSSGICSNAIASVVRGSFFVRCCCRLVIDTRIPRCGRPRRVWRRVERKYSEWYVGVLSTAWGLGCRVCRRIRWEKKSHVTHFPSLVLKSLLQCLHVILACCVNMVPFWMSGLLSLHGICSHPIGQRMPYGMVMVSTTTCVVAPIVDAAVLYGVLDLTRALFVLLRLAWHFPIGRAWSWMGMA